MVSFKVATIFREVRHVDKTGVSNLTLSNCDLYLSDASASHIQLIELIFACEGNPFKAPRQLQFNPLDSRPPSEPVERSQRIG